MTHTTTWQFYWLCEWPVLCAIAVIALATIAASICTRRLDWLVIGGGLLTIIGIPLTVWRVLRRGPAGANDEAPPPVLPTGGPGVLFNMERVRFDIERTRHNFAVISGAVALGIGTLLSAIIAPVLHLLGWS